MPRLDTILGEYWAESSIFCMYEEYKLFLAKEGIVPV